jgi:hypothetical protein
VCTRRKVNTHTVGSPFNAQLRRQVDGEIQTVRELNREEARIKLGVAKSEKLKWHSNDSSMIENLTRQTKERQKHGVHCDLWVQRLASSNSFKNNFTAINHLQKKKYASFWKLLDKKIKQQTVADLPEKLPSRLHDPPQGIKLLFEDNCFNQCQIV